jgi:tRNA pseudouridine38-40 synthase
MQPNGIAVERVINKALSELLKEDIIIAGASRTDSGVHADGNVAVFDTETRIPADKICFALNQRLPKDIVCTSSCEVKPDFHPRHADCTKTYEYTIYNAVHPDPIKRRYSYFVYVPLDIDAMRQAAEYLKGEHDFASFCSAHAQVKTTVRKIYSLDIIQGDGSLIEKENNEDKKEATDIDGPQRIYVSHDIKIRISGNGFLYNMVRIIVGTLVKVGYHFYPPEYVKTILDACDRTKAGPKAPAEGLKLVGIEYNPEDYKCVNGDGSI